MGWFSSITSLLDKYVPSRKAAIVDQLNAMTAEYQKALLEGRDTDAAKLLKQLKDLRAKIGYTEGDV